jgi:membrane protein DedA with SNARE-associated domain
MTTHLTSSVAQHGVYAIFVLMALDALVPVGGELIMLYAGVVAAGAIAGAHPSVFGAQLSGGVETYVVLALSGTLGYLSGSLVGWLIGARGGRALIDRHGRWIHLSPPRFDRAERWFARHGSWAVLLGRVTPLVRSFISIPAGVLGSRIVPYLLLTLLGSAVWCFGFAAAGWALGGSWEKLHHAFRYADYAAVVAVVALAGFAVHRARGSRARV